MKQPNIGDLIEIQTPKGVAYALYTHKKPKFGPLLRVFEKLWSSPTSLFEDVVAGAIRFEIFFPLKAALDERIVRVVSNHEIPKELKQFPVFRTGMVDPKTKKVSVWWLWDGDREWRVGSLAPEERCLPIRGVWNDTMLFDRIVSDWRPEIDPR